MLNVNQLVGFGAGQADKLVSVLTYDAQSGSTSNSASYTFSAVSIGTANATRTVIVCVGTDQADGTAPVMSSVTLDGNAMSPVLEKSQAAGGVYAGIFALAWPTGTTAEFIVTLTATMQRCRINVFDITNLSDKTAASTLTADADANGTMTGTINQYKNGAVIGFSHVKESGTFTWTNLTENYDGQNENACDSSASTSPTVYASGVSITSDNSVSSTRGVLAVVSWG